MSRVTDMTKGSPARLMINFAIPLIITNIGQQFYMIVDAAIVGRGVGVKALAAVGCTDWTYWLILWSVISLTQGFATFISRYFGEKDYEKMNRAIATSALLCVISGIVLTILGLVFADYLLKVLKTPEDVFYDASVYIKTMTAGTLIISAYNMASSVLRAFGDGKTPLVAMIIAAICNILLDLLCVMVFKLGVFGAAIATLTAQMVSFLYCVFKIGKIEIINIKKEYFKLDKKMSFEMLKFGIPLSFQHIIISVGGMIAQSTINLQGSMFVAGYTATNKLYGLMESTALSLGGAFTTFTSQNFGAKKYDRVKKGFHTSEILSVASSVIVALIMLPLGKILLSLFIDSNEAGAQGSLEIAHRFYIIMVLFVFSLNLIYSYRCTLQGIGNSFWSMLSGFCEAVVRVVMAKGMFYILGKEALFFMEPMAWIGAMLTVIFPCYYYIRKLLS